MGDVPPNSAPHDETPEGDALEYVGAPTEFADADEVPSWLANLVKAIVFIPSLFAVFSTVELILVVVGLLVACLCLVGSSVLMHVF